MGLSHPVKRMNILSNFERAEVAGERVFGEPFHVLWKGRKIAVLETKHGPRAFEDSCPHMGASMLMGDRDDASIVCPWHGWKFDLETGACANSAYANLALFDVLLRGNEVWLRDRSTERD